jgi:hypothetical protein
MTNRKTARGKRPANTTEYVILTQGMPWQYWDGSAWSKNQKDARIYVGDEVFPISETIPNCQIMRAAFALLNLTRSL